MGGEASKMGASQEDLWPLLDEAAVMRHLEGDEHTKVILGYCESVDNGQERLARLVRNAARAYVRALQLRLEPHDHGPGLRAAIWWPRP